MLTTSYKVRYNQHTCCNKTRLLNESPFKRSKTLNHTASWTPQKWVSLQLLLFLKQPPNLNHRHATQAFLLINFTFDQQNTKINNLSFGTQNTRERSYVHRTVLTFNIYFKLPTCLHYQHTIQPLKTAKGCSISSFHLLLSPKKYGNFLS